MAPESHQGLAIPYADGLKGVTSYLSSVVSLNVNPGGRRSGGVYDVSNARLAFDNGWDAPCSLDFVGSCLVDHSFVQAA